MFKMPQSMKLVTPKEIIQNIKRDREAKYKKIGSLWKLTDENVTVVN